MIRWHVGLAFRATNKDVVGDSTWQTITAYNRTHHDKRENSIYHFLLQRKKDMFKAPWVRADVPRIDMVHH
jgi:hypothetical protein